MVELFTTRDSLEDGLSAAVAIRLPGVGGVVIGTETGVEAAGVVGAGMGVLGAGVDGAGVDGAGVLGAVEILPLSGVSSINGGRIPVALGRRPEALGRTPEVLGKMPEVLGKMPEVLGKMPEVLAKAPDTLGRMPEVLGTMGPLGLIRALAGSSGCKKKKKKKENILLFQKSLAIQRKKKNTIISDQENVHMIAILLTSNYSSRLIWKGRHEFCINPEKLRSIQSVHLSKFLILINGQS